MQEASETQCWLELATACSYITINQFNEMDKNYERIIAMLNGMEKQAKKFVFKSNSRSVRCRTSAFRSFGASIYLNHCLVDKAHSPLPIILPVRVRMRPRQKVE